MSVSYIPESVKIRLWGVKGGPPPGRTVAAGALRWSPSPPFWRDSTAATRHGNLDPICRCPFLPSVALNARPEDVLAVENDVVPFDRADVLGAGLRPGLPW